MKNIQHSTFNIQRPGLPGARLPWRLNVECWALNVPKFLLISAIQVYRTVISPAQIFLFGSTGGCRFTPTCSAYTVDALTEHGAVAGTFLAAKRICRCHPWGDCGHDPVPKGGKQPVLRSSTAEGGKAESRNLLRPAHSSLVTF